MAMRSKQNGQSAANICVVIDDDQIQGLPRLTMPSKMYARSACLSSNHKR
jgi:hypothetical protein